MTQTGEAKVISDINKLAEVFDAKKVMVLNKTFIFNHHLLHPKMLDVFLSILKEEHNNDLDAVFISETGPDDRYGEYYPDLKAMAISMPFLLGETLKAIETNNKNFGIASALWINMIHTFCHELHHNVAYAIDWDATNNNRQVEEEEAHDFGLYMVEKIQKTMDAEPPALGQMPWFGPRVMQHMIDKIQTEDVGWIKQKDMADTGLVYSDGDKQFTNLKEYYEATNEDKSIENKGAELKLAHQEKLQHIKTLQQNEELKHIGEDNADAFDQATLAAEEKVIEASAGTFGYGSEEIIGETATTEPQTERSQEEIMNMAFGKTADAATKLVAQSLSPEDMADLDMQEQFSGRVDEGGMMIADGIADPTEAKPFETNPFGTKPMQITPPGTEVFKMLKTDSGPGTIQEAARALWMKLYNHMFNACGWQNGSFTYANAVTMPISISENKLAVTMVGSDTVVGGTFVNGTLPYYDVNVTVNGQKTSIRLLAQNPAKNSEPGRKAREGHKIAWIINQTTEEWVGLIDNGVYHRKETDGKWVAIA